MGTRCLTILNDKDKEIAVLYRQSDGYPDGHGKDLAEFLKDRILINGIQDYSVRAANGESCLAAQIVANFKDEIGGFYLHPAGTRDVGEDYIYDVKCALGEEAKIKVEAHGEDIFSGTATELLDLR